MADGVVGVIEATIPDVYVDNEIVTNSASADGTAYRLRVEDPELTAVLHQIRDALATLTQCVVPPVAGASPQLRVTWMQANTSLAGGVAISTTIAWAMNAAYTVDNIDQFGAMGTPLGGIVRSPAFAWSDMINMLGMEQALLGVVVS